MLYIFPFLIDVIILGTKIIIYSTLYSKTLLYDRYVFLLFQGLIHLNYNGKDKNEEINKHM